MEVTTSDYMLASKDSDRFIRFLCVLLGTRFKTDYWTTIRLPWWRLARIYYPPRTLDPSGRDTLIAHEMHHVRQLKPWWGPWVSFILTFVAPLPVLFSGRWFLEREAYVQDIHAGHVKLDDTVDELWDGKVWCWPKPLMRRWFIARLAELPS